MGQDALSQMRFTAMGWQGLEWEKMYSGRIQLHSGWEKKYLKCS